MNEICDWTPMQLLNRINSCYEETKAQAKEIEALNKHIVLLDNRLTTLEDAKQDEARNRAFAEAYPENK